MIAALLLRIKGWLIAAGALVAALLYAWWRGRSGAQENAESERAQRNAEAAQQMQQAAEDRTNVENDIASRSDARDRLRDEWTSPD